MSTTIRRLDALPRKIQAPLRELLSAGQLNEETVDVVLDAVELVGTPHKALGFAVGFLHLQSKGVPVKDVVKMAREQGRRIRLEWSERRWRSEHDRLSRAETLKRLAGENVRYAVDDVRKLLPDRMPGYLIGSSRRLGMEGLRQRHCVASYHAQIQAGYCVIATIFMDRRRWTVQLAKTGDSRAPLRIAQIRSRFNGTPDRETVEWIHARLGIEYQQPLIRALAEESAIPRTYMENLRRILPVLNEHGVRTVTVSFDGSGDSGSIQGIEYDEKTLTPSSILVEANVVQRSFNGREWIANHVLQPMNLNDAIEAVTDDYLAETGVDWYNNDGGYGELIIDVAEGTVALEVNVRFTESSTQYSSTKEIETGEELDD